MSIPKLLVVFDLDETLVFTRLVRPDSVYSDPEDFQIDLGDARYKVFVRPGARELIDYCQRRFSVGVWSSAKPDYVQALTKKLFDVSKLAFVRHRHHCRQVPADDRFDAGAVKDLMELEHPIERILLVDDDDSTARRNPDNLISVRVFRDHPQGDDLHRALTTINNLANSVDVRTENRGRKNEAAGQPYPEAHDLSEFGD